MRAEDYILNQQRQNDAMALLNAQQLHENLSQQARSRDQMTLQERQYLQQQLMAQLEAALRQRAAQQGYGHERAMQNDRQGFQAGMAGQDHLRDLERLGIVNRYGADEDKRRFGYDMQRLGSQQGFQREMSGMEHGQDMDMQRLQDELLRGRLGDQHRYGLEEMGQEYGYRGAMQDQSNRQQMLRDQMGYGHERGMEELQAGLQASRDQALHRNDLEQLRQQFGNQRQMAELQGDIQGRRDRSQHGFDMEQIGQRFNLEAEQARLQGLRERGTAIDQLAGQVGAYLPRMQDHLQGQAKAIMSRAQSLQEAFENGDLRELEYLQMKANLAPKLMQFANPQNFKPLGSMPSDWVTDDKGRKIGVRTNDGKVDTQIRDPRIEQRMNPFTGQPEEFQVDSEGHMEPLTQMTKSGQAFDPSKLMQQAITNAQMKRSSEDTTPVTDAEVQREYQNLVRLYGGQAGMGQQQQGGMMGSATGQAMSPQQQQTQQTQQQLAPEEIEAAHVQQRMQVGIDALRNKDMSNPSHADAFLKTMKGVFPQLPSSLFQQLPFEIQQALLQANETMKAFRTATPSNSRGVFQQKRPMGIGQPSVRGRP